MNLLTLQLPEPLSCIFVSWHPYQPPDAAMHGQEIIVRNALEGNLHKLSTYFHSFIF